MPFRVALTFDAEHPDRPHRAGGDRAGPRRARRGRRSRRRSSSRAAGPRRTRRSRGRSPTAGTSSATTPSTMPGCRCCPPTASRRTCAPRSGRSSATTGVDPRPWFRCPFGAGTRRPGACWPASTRLGYREIALGRRRRSTGEPAGAAGAWPAQMRRRRPSRTATARSSCSIRGRRRRRSALPALIDGLRDAGATFVRLDALRVRTVLAVDGGNSKTDVALVAEDGRLLAAVRGPTSSHQAVGLEAGMERLAGLVAEAVAAAGRRRDRARCRRSTRSPAPTRRPTSGCSTGALAARGFARPGPRAQRRLRRRCGPGTDRGWGVVVICGQGVNAAGVAPDGRTARLDALGDISGDWGGGTDVGWQGWRRRSGRATAAGRGRAWSATCRPISGCRRRR